MSAHQKQMRFLTGLGMAIGTVFFAAMLWLVNRPVKF